MSTLYCLNFIKLYWLYKVETWKWYPYSPIMSTVRVNISTPQSHHFILSHSGHLWPFTMHLCGIEFNKPKFCHPRSFFLITRNNTPLIILYHITTETLGDFMLSVYLPLKHLHLNILNWSVMISLICRFRNSHSISAFQYVQSQKDWNM